MRDVLAEIETRAGLAPGELQKIIDEVIREENDVWANLGPLCGVDPSTFPEMRIPAHATTAPQIN